MLAGTLLCAALATCSMIGWNIMVTERECACRPPHRRRRSYRRRRRRSSLDRRSCHRASCDRSVEAITATTGTIDTNTNTDTPPRSENGDNVEREEEKEKCCATATTTITATTTTACPPCAIPSTEPPSVGRCPVSPGIEPRDGALSPAELSSPVVFNDLVLILDAPALPPPPWKLPNLPEEMDVSASTDNMTLDSDPSLAPNDCDLCPEFHLSAPWSPRARRSCMGNERRRSSPLGNRPRTFSEYSAGPSSGSSPPSPLLSERSSSVGAGLPSVTWGMQEGEGGGGSGMRNGREGRRTRSFTCGSADHPVADWSNIGQGEIAARNDNGGDSGGTRSAASSCTPSSSSSSKVGRGINGDHGGINGSSPDRLDRPPSPLYPRHHSSQVPLRINLR